MWPYNESIHNVLASVDDAADHLFGLLCNDGQFEEPSSWPDESECVEVDTCTNIPQPPDDSLFDAIGVTEIPTGDSVDFFCTDTNAVLDDDSGLNVFSLKCEGTELGTMQDTDDDNVEEFIAG